MDWFTELVENVGALPLAVVVGLIALVVIGLKDNGKGDGQGKGRGPKHGPGQSPAGSPPTGPPPAPPVS